MRILFDHQIFSAQTYGGISRYFFELICAYRKMEGIEAEIALRFSNNYYLKDIDFIKVSSFFDKHKIKGKNLVLSYFNEFISRKKIEKGNYDILHPTFYNPYFLKHIGNKKYILTVYDMIHEIFSETFTPSDKTAEHKRMVVERAEKIIAISESTKRDIIRSYGIDENKIDVIYLANSLTPENIKPKKTSSLPERYILFVGNRWGYKNFERFIVAVTPLLLEDKSLYVISAGGGDFHSEELKLFQKLKINSRVKYHSADNESLVLLYQQALAFVFPSLYEGFGIPILEAMACSCPAILSNTSSLPEVGGDAAQYFNPNDELSIRDSIAKVLLDNDLRLAMKQKGLEQSSKFTWTKTAEETVRAYRSIL